jgi:GNAT superfamily N-acetyltransferase
MGANHLNIDFQPISSDGLGLCATMMVATPPWSVLGFTTERCLTALSNTRMVVVGAYSEGVLVGFAAMLAEGIEFEPLLVFLCVVDGHRGRGLGAALLNYFEERFWESANLYVFVADVNPGAQRFYQRFGYLQIGALPDFNWVGQTKFLYRKSRRVLNSSQNQT